MTTHPTTTTSTEAPDRPPAGIWELDPGHAEVAFVGRHFMLTRVRGRFTDVAATVRIGERVEDTRIEATIGMASVDSGFRERDDHLRSADFFDVERFPTAVFRSDGLRWDGQAGVGVVHGELTIRGRTRPVELAVEYLGAVTDPWGGNRTVFAARGRIDREDWDLTWNVPLDTGGLLVSREIELEVHAELLRRG